MPRVLFSIKKHFAKRGKKKERMDSMAFQAPNEKAINKVRYIFGEKQI